MYEMSQTDYDDLFLNSSVPANGAPGMVPYGDVLGYTAQGIGDVDGDGFGDFAATWYEADKDRGGPCGEHPDPWTSPHETTVVNPSGMERVGFVRVMSGNPSYSSSCGSDPDILNYFNTPPAADNDIRRIGAEDFWGGASSGLWSHEITTLGDIDKLPDANGNYNSEIMLCANPNMVGRAEIWSYTDRYSSTGSFNATKRWVRLMVIEEISPSTGDEKQEEFGYQSYEGPPPDSQFVSLSHDFNNDGSADLMIASKWYRDEGLGHAVNSGGSSDARKHGAGAAWIFMLPTHGVWQEVNRVSAMQNECLNNRPEMHHSGPDDVTDILPLRMTTDEYSVKIVGHQFQNPHTMPTTDKFPRHFGFEIAPAGDIDGDGKLDLAVSAPLHYSDSANPNNTIPTDYHTGRLYFFLNNSTIRQGDNNPSNDAAWSTLTPKYTLTNQFRIGQPDSSCVPQPSYYTHRISNNNNMSANQTTLLSSDADYVIEGGIPAQSNYSIQPAFAHKFVSGVNLDNNTFTNNAPDPEIDYLSDIAIYHDRTNSVYVIRDLYTILDSSGQLNPTSQVTLWSADDSLASGSHAVFNTADDVFAIRGYSTAFTTHPTTGMPITNVRTAGPGGHANPATLIVGGDQDNDGDCELFVTCNVSTDTNYNDAAVLVFDIEPLTSVTSDAALLSRYLPEDYSWEDTSMYANGSSSIKYNQQSNFNLAHKLVRTVSMNAWPVWQDGEDDTLIGVRHFPRRITHYPNGAKDAWLEVPDFANTSLSGEEYDKKTLVPAGKIYYLDNKIP
tara:strand:+ start:1365 stop:3710 length:2346 start_codon:yes stop_codon:yes gene_type:complete